MSDTPVIEALLLRWSESHNGRTVTLQLSADGDHPFRGLPCGPSNGQRLAIAIALIADDETTHDMPTQAPARPAGGGNGKGASRRPFNELPRSQQAGILCGEGAFATFLRDSYFGALVLNAEGATDAAATLRSICHVDSRREFDLNEDAGQSFDALRDDYRFWLNVP